jgi:hypothetical protein
MAADPKGTVKEPQGLIGRLMQIKSACLRHIDQTIKSLDQQSWNKQHVCLVPDNIDDCSAMLQ